MIKSEEIERLEKEFELASKEAYSASLAKDEARRRKAVQEKIKIFKQLVVLCNRPMTHAKT